MANEKRFVLSYFNPRAPDGARPEVLREIHRVTKISIHAPLTGRDRRVLRAESGHFNPRVPDGA